jgi:hypothetical protein
MIALLCFVLTVLVSPFKSKSRLEAENAALSNAPILLQFPGQRCQFSLSGRRAITITSGCPLRRNLSLLVTAWRSCGLPANYNVSDDALGPRPSRHTRLDGIGLADIRPMILPSQEALKWCALTAH